MHTFAKYLILSTCSMTGLYLYFLGNKKNISILPLIFTNPLLDICNVDLKEKHINQLFHNPFIYTIKFIRLTRVMVYPVGKDSFCRGLPICLGRWHASKTIYTNGGGNAGHCWGADAWGSTTTCSH